MKKAHKADLYIGWFCVVLGCGGILFGIIGLAIGQIHFSWIPFIRGAIFIPISILYGFKLLRQYRIARTEEMIKRILGDDWSIAREKQEARKI